MILHIETGIVFENRKQIKKVMGNDRYSKLLKERKLEFINK